MSKEPTIAKGARSSSKSFFQIENQASRLISRAEENYDFERIDRIGEIRQRYRDNISRALGGVDLHRSGIA